jgi:hypothetical protein
MNTLYRCLSPDCLTDIAFNNSRHELSKRVNPNAIITTARPAIRTVGIMSLILWTANDLTDMVLRLSDVTPQLLGLNNVISLLPGLVGVQTNTMVFRNVIPNFAFINRFFTVVVYLQLAPGISSWQEAFQLLDPQGGSSVLSGQGLVGSFIWAAMDQMIQQNYMDGWYQIATQAVLQGPTSSQNAQMVVLGLYINIDTYNP